jgi:hypothetical protein
MMKKYCFENPKLTSLDNPPYSVYNSLMKMRRVKDMSIKPELAPGERSGIQPIPVENLETGRPTVLEAQRRLENLLTRYKQQGQPVLKIIHGYGSSGVGGALRTELRRWLHGRVKSKAIIDIIPGEDFERGIKVIHHLKDFPQLEWDNDFNKQNRGVTIILIQK